MGLIHSLLHGESENSQLFIYIQALYKCLITHRDIIVRYGAQLCSVLNK